MTNTSEQIAMHKAQEEAWAEERTWPIWDIVITGDEVLWNARSGVNEAEEDTTVELKIDGHPVNLSRDSENPEYKRKVQAGDAMPWIAPAKASVTTRARTQDEAAYRALQANPGYHTVGSVKKRKG